MNKEQLESEIEMLQTDYQELKEKYDILLKQIMALRRALKRTRDEASRVIEEDDTSFWMYVLKEDNSGGVRRY